MISGRARFSRGADRGLVSHPLAKRIEEYFRGRQIGGLEPFGEYKPVHMSE
jgi:hypothetical protein